VDVIEDHDQRSGIRERLQELPNRPERLLWLRWGVGESECAGYVLHDRARVFVAGQQRCDLRAHFRRGIRLLYAGRLLHDPSDRPERDSLPVRKASALQDPGTIAETADELVREP
jgi:hypothetical protein